MAEPDPNPPTLSRESSELLGRRRRARNWLMLILLVGIVVLFYFIAIAKLSYHAHAG